MTLDLATILPWVLSANTIVTMFWVGNKDWRGWALGLGAQVLWFYWIYLVAAWGLLPGAIALTFVYARNLRKWLREHSSPIGL